ncbi:MAG: alpha-hydroxy-acid oxidizing protein [Thiotrichales bacterium]|nr:alpha-hydroxy-acid oxidizing protein [Thiotrichales bacterium]
MITDYAQLQGHVLCAQDFVALAQSKLEPGLFAYLSGGSGQEQALQRNLAAFAQAQLQPNSLENIRHGHSDWQLDATRFSAPIFLAPVAHQGLVHPHGELACAQAAEAMRQGMLLSTLSSFGLEDVAETAPQGWKAFQLYHQPRLEDSLDLIHRAKQAGYQRLVITVDAPIQQVSLQARRLGFSLPSGTPVNLQTYSVNPIELAANQSVIFQGFMAHALNWEILERLVEYSHAQALPVWIKGVLAPHQAVRLQKMGVEGLIVSNHGGRSLDKAPSSLSALPAIRQAVGNKMLLLLDSGIHSGQDIFVALANGANAVLIGRLQIYALAVAGALGVAHLLKLLTEELQLCMALCGCDTLDSIQPHLLWEPSHV